MPDKQFGAIHFDSFALYGSQGAIDFAAFQILTFAEKQKSF